MSLRDIDIRPEYRSPEDNMIRQFYIPLLREAIIYKRAVGFFTSSALVDISKGISGLVKNGGKIQIVTSPRLYDEDIMAIERGYLNREKVVENALIRELKDVTGYFESERLNLLANLISEGILDIKVALLENNNKGIGMYHEKMGIIIDADENKIAFSGSMNESSTAIEMNYETTDVYLNWKPEDEIRYKLKETAFDTIWNDLDPSIRVLRFPKVSQTIIDKYKRGKPNLNIDAEQYYDLNYEGDTTARKRVIGARIPDSINLYSYQIEAINKWEDNNYIGIFDMATGTGKTLTGLGAIARLSVKVKDKLAVFIVCPYQHLVEQWVEDIIKFNINPIVGYSSPEHKNWKRDLHRAVMDQKLRDDKSFFCLVCTNVSFKSKEVQDEINKIKSSILLVVDEAHNAGAASFMKYLDNRFTYRLALSATLDRHMDEYGTEALHKFFGETCIHYPLELAIKENKLTPYKYYALPVSLTEDELYEYIGLTKEIGKCYIRDKRSHKKKLNDKGKKLAIKRSRIVAAARNKLVLLKEYIHPYVHSKDILIYCGATDVYYDGDTTQVEVEDIKQVDAVTRILGNELGMTVARFTAQEKMPERELIKDSFQKGNLQAIVAIKCLDEGMNIPGIRTAFILASTTNPKEYIQRRGRVLRKAPGKDYAEIYDFITLPRPLEDVASLTMDEMKYDRRLAINEIRRMIEFNKASLNPMNTQDLMWKIQETYHITEDEIEGKVDDDEL